MLSLKKEYYDIWYSILKLDFQVKINVGISVESRSIFQ